MQKFIVGSIIGMVIGALFGASVVAPRLSDASLQRPDKDGNAVVTEQMEPPKIVNTLAPVSPTAAERGHLFTGTWSVHFPLPCRFSEPYRNA